MATFFEGVIDLRKAVFPVKPTGDVKWAYTSPWGQRWGRWHNGVDIGSSHFPYYETCYGWPLLALFEGDVVYRYDPVSGHNVTLYTEYGAFIYCHMQEGGRNRHVKAGEQIGKVGTSGNVSAHVHFIWYDNHHPLPTARNPMPLLDAVANASWGNEHTPTPPQNPDTDSEDKEQGMLGLVVDSQGSQWIVELDGLGKKYLENEDPVALLVFMGAKDLRRDANGEWWPQDELLSTKSEMD